MEVSPEIQKILDHNAAFVAAEEYRQYETNKYPDKKLAIVSCMDTRLTELLPKALGLKNGDAKIIKVAGAEVSEPYGSVMRSLLVAVYELGVEDVMIVAHTDCGAQHMSAEEMVPSMKEAGVSIPALKQVEEEISLTDWLAGFGDTEEAVHRSVSLVRDHPLMPPSVRVNGFVINTATGELKLVE